jgi:hypothetical protein
MHEAHHDAHELDEAESPRHMDSDAADYTQGHLGEEEVDYGDEWDDSDWENEDRADEPWSGREMDGLDVGCIPTRNLELPKPAVPYLTTGIYGRSMFTSEFVIPSVHMTSH